MKPPERILLVRNDKIGDFMLAWPAFSLLKQQYPHAEITALVPEYTALLAKQCPSIDRVLIDNRESSFIKDISKLSKKIKEQDFDLSVCFYLEARTAISLLLAGIKQRVGPATRVAQIYLNRTLRQRRSQSIKPEFEYNLDLARYAISLFNDAPAEVQQAPFLQFDNKEKDVLRHDFINTHALTEDTKLIIIHPGTGGSAINLSLAQYAEIALTINREKNTFVIITAGPGEHETAIALSTLIKETDHCIHYSTTGIIDFCKFINLADVFISGSTGPLHIAGALDICTAAFYPARRSATSLRWQTLNSDNRRLAFSPGVYTGDDDMKQINVLDAAKEIIRRFIS